MDFQKKYWSKDEFVDLNDKEYNGYVGVSDEKAYKYDTHEPLTQNDYYKTQINVSKDFFDRTLAHELELPHKKNVLQFAANDFLYTSTVKDIIEKLQENNNYIYRNAIISDTNLPSTENCQSATTDANGALSFGGFLEADNKGLIDNYYPNVTSISVPKVIRESDGKLLDKAEENIKFKATDRENKYPLDNDKITKDDYLKEIYEELHPTFESKNNDDDSTNTETKYYFNAYPGDSEIITKKEAYTHAEKSGELIPYLAYCFETDLEDGGKLIAKRKYEKSESIKYVEFGQKDKIWQYDDGGGIDGWIKYDDKIVPLTKTGQRMIPPKVEPPTITKIIYLIEPTNDSNPVLRPNTGNMWFYGEDEEDENILYDFFGDKTADAMAEEMLADTSEANKRFENCISEFYDYATGKTYYKIIKTDGDGKEHYYFARGEKLLRELTDGEKTDLGGTIEDGAKAGADAYKDTNGVGSITVTVTTPSADNNSSTNKIPLTEFFYEYLESKDSDTVDGFTNGTFKIDFSTEYKRFKGMVSDETSLEGLLKIEILGLTGDTENPKYDTLETMEKSSYVITDEVTDTSGTIAKVITFTVPEGTTVVGACDTKNGYLKNYNLKITFGDTDENGDYEMLKKYTEIPLVTKSQLRHYTYYDKDDSYQGDKTLYENYTFENIQSLTNYGSLAYQDENGIPIPPSLFNSYKENPYYKIHYPLPTATATDVYNSIKKLKKDDNIIHIYPIIKSSDIKYDIEKDETDKTAKFYSNPDYVENIYDIITYEIVDNKIVKTYKTASKINEDLYGEAENPKYDKIPYIKHVTETTISEAKKDYNFNEIVSSELCVYDATDLENIKMLLFLVFEDKILILKLSHNTSTNETKIITQPNEGVIINTIDPSNANSLKFKKLSSIKVFKNFLYLCDEVLNAVFQYNIEYLISSSENNGYDKESIRLINYLQGDGKKTDNLYFNRPTCIDVCEDKVYVLDRGNSCVKVYNQQLNYITTLQNGYFSNHDIQSIAVNPHPTVLSDGTKVDKNSLWIFSVQGVDFFVSILFDNEVVSYGQIEDIHVLDGKYSWEEEIKQVKFSFTNSNYYYFCTTKRVYKFHASKPLYPFASLSYYKQRSIVDSLVWSRFNHKWHKPPTLINDTNGVLSSITWDYSRPKSSAEVLKNRCFALCGHNRFEGDMIFHFGTLYDESNIEDYIKTNSTKYENGTMTFDDIPTEELLKYTKAVGLMFYNEKDSYISSLTNIDLTSYEKYSISENIDDEYVNPLTFNKLIYKVAFNLIQLKRNIIGNFRAATNLDNVIVYDNLLLDDFFDKLKMGNSDNYFIHDNEPISININRVFENILDVQEQIIKHMQTKFMSTQSFINSTSRRI